MTDDERYMRQALDQAHRAAEMGEVPVGAVITAGGRTIARAHNLCERLNDFTAHAEMQAFTSASEYLGGKFLDQCTLYVTLEPCHMCYKAIVDARIDSLYFGANELKTGAIESVDHFLDKNHLNHKMLFSGGYLQKQSSNLLREFFQSKRKKKIS